MDFVTPTLQGQNRMIQGLALKQERDQQQGFSNALASAYSGQRPDMAGFDPEQVTALQAALSQASDQQRAQAAEATRVMQYVHDNTNEQNYPQMAALARQYAPDLQVPGTYQEFLQVKPQFGAEIGALSAALGMAQEGGYTLSPGAARYGPQGDVIAQNTNLSPMDELSQQLKEQQIETRAAEEQRRAEKATREQTEFETEQSERAETEAKGTRQAEGLVEIAKKLIDDKKGLEAFSGYSGIAPTVRPQSRSWEANLDRLLGALTLENVDLLTGILSDSDILLLRNAATSIIAGGEVTENEAELYRILNTLETGLGLDLTATPTIPQTRGQMGRRRTSVSDLSDEDLLNF